VASYEQLRREWLDGDRVQERGLALFLRSGMSAWVRAWRGCGRSREDHRRGAVERVSGSAGAHLPSGVYADAVYVLAEVVMSRLEGVSL